MDVYLKTTTSSVICAPNFADLVTYQKELVETLPQLYMVPFNKLDLAPILHSIEKQVVIPILRLLSSAEPSRKIQVDFVIRYCLSL